MCTCDQALDLISAKLDNALTEFEAKQLEEHLNSCPACRALLADFEDIHDTFPQMWVEPPADLTEKIMTAVKADNVIQLQLRRRQAVKKHWKQWAGLAAMFCVVIFGLHALPDMGSNMDSSSSSSSSISSSTTSGSSYVAESAPREMPDEGTMVTTDTTADAPVAAMAEPESATVETESSMEIPPVSNALLSIEPWMALESVWQGLGGSETYPDSTAPVEGDTQIILGEDADGLYSILVYDEDMQAVHQHFYTDDTYSEEAPQEMDYTWFFE